MSIVNNALVAIAATALGVVVEANALPISEQLLNDIAVSNVQAAEVNDKGRCLVLVTVNKDGGGTEVRPVADANGNVKLYVDGAAVVAMAKKSNLPGGQAVTIVKKAVNKPVGDPIAALKSKHKQAAAEAVAAQKPTATLAQQINGATSLGWNTDPVGSMTRMEFDDMERRALTVAEWKAKCDARVAQLAAALVAAGIDPVTYLPLPAPAP